MSDVTECSIISKVGGLTGYWRQRAGSWGRQAMLSDLLKKGKTAAHSPVCQSIEGVGGGFCHFFPGIKLLLGHGGSGSHWFSDRYADDGHVCP